MTSKVKCGIYLCIYKGKIYKLIIDRHNGRFSEATTQELGRNEEIAEDRKANIEPVVFVGIILAVGVITVIIKKTISIEGYPFLCLDGKMIFYYA